MAISQNFPSIAPSLSLNFASSRTLDPRITFTRTSSATCVGPNGLLRVVSANEPRFDHNPTTGESLGLLVEEQRTNLLLQSEDFGTTWTVHEGLSRTANQIVSPSGSITADLLASNGVNTGYVEQPTASSNQFFSGTTYTYSVYLKKANTSTCLTLLFGITFNSGGGNPVATWNLDTGIPSFSNGATGSMTPVGNGWYRCVMTDTATQTHTQNQQWLRMASASGDVYVWGAQLEAGAFPTSYIPTTTAAVTRSADVASITGTAFSSWYRQDEGTMFASTLVQDFTETTFPRIFSFDRGDWSANFIAAVRGSGTNRLDYSIFAGTGQAVGLNNGIAPTANTVANGAWVYKTDDFIGAIGGVLTNSDTSGSVPTSLTALGIGMQGNATLHYNGTIRRLAYWPARLPNSTLQSITQ